MFDCQVNKHYIRTFAMIKPDAYTSIGKIIEIIEQSGFVIGNMKMAKYSLGDAQEFYGEHRVAIEFLACVTKPDLY